MVQSRFLESPAHCSYLTKTFLMLKITSPPALIKHRRSSQKKAPTKQAKSEQEDGEGPTFSVRLAGPRLFGLSH